MPQMINLRRSPCYCTIILALGYISDPVYSLGHLVYGQILFQDFKRFYRVKIFKMGKISFFLLFGPPLRKNRSQGPENTCNLSNLTSIVVKMLFKNSRLSFCLCQLQLKMCKMSNSADSTLIYSRSLALTTNFGPK